MRVRVSVVEDDIQTRELLTGWISRSEDFCCVSQHGSAEEAVRTLQQARPEIVLMDINLPGINGPDCVAQLKPLLPDTQFVMLTVYEDADHIFQALRSGAVGYLLKQVKRDELLAALRQVHAGGSPMTPSIASKVIRMFQQSSPHLQGKALVALSPRESEVLQLLSQGLLYKEIADTLSIKTTTVDWHIRGIYAKLHVRSRSEAIAVFAHLPIRASSKSRS